MSDECSYNNCNKDAVTTLQIDGEEVPTCADHASALADGDNGETGDRPVLSNSDDQAAWINTTDDGKPYISVKIEDGEYVNLFAKTHLIQDALNRQHQVTQDQ